MHEEWFEKLAKKKDVIEVKENKNSISIVFSPEVSKKIDIEDLFVEACKITRMFRFQFTSESLIIVLDTIKLDNHPVYYLLQILNKIKYKTEEE